jgi:hypothetical protein
MAREMRIFANRHSARGSPRRHRDLGAASARQSSSFDPEALDGPKSGRNKKDSRRDAEAQRRAGLNPFQTLRPGVSARDTVPLILRSGPRQTNPILWTKGPFRSGTVVDGHRAKQSQFPDEGGLSPVLRRCYGEIISRPGVQNKTGMPWAEGSFRADTSRDRPACQTKPIGAHPAPRKPALGLAKGRTTEETSGDARPTRAARANAKSRIRMQGRRESGGSVKAEGLGDGPTHGKSAIAKLRGLRLTLPPTPSCDFAFALTRAGEVIYRGLGGRYTLAVWSWSHPKVWFKELSLCFFRDL